MVPGPCFTGENRVQSTTIQRFLKKKRDDSEEVADHRIAGRGPWFDQVTHPVGRLDLKPESECSREDPER